MKATAQQIFDAANVAFPALDELTFSTFKLNYRIGRTHDKLRSRARVLGLQLQKLMRVYAVKGDNGAYVLSQFGQPTIQPDKIDEYNEKVEELNNSEIEIEGVEPLKQSDFTEDDLKKLSTKVFSNMGPFLED